MADQYISVNGIARKTKAGYIGVNGIARLFTLDTSDATAAAEDIASGKTAYVNGGKVMGSAKLGGNCQLNISTGISFSAGTCNTIPYSSYITLTGNFSGKVGYSPSLPYFSIVRYADGSLRIYNCDLRSSHSIDTGIYEVHFI